MPENKTYKICLVGNSLSGGGAEKAHSVLSNSLHKAGFEIHNLLFDDMPIDYEFSGELFILDFKPSLTYVTKIKRLIALNQYIKRHNFDYIIDFRYRGTWYTEWIIVRYIFSKSNYIPRIASYNTELYFTNNNFVSRNLYKKAFAIHTVSEGLELKVRERYNYKNVRTVYNSIELDKIQSLAEELIDINYEYIIAVGRMAADNVKQQDVIIEAYAKSVLSQKDIKLVLLGDGENKNNLKKLVTKLQLTDKVVFVDFKANPFPYIKNAKFLVLASKYEGFPNVILESFACETPVVSYDCQTGPSEVINHKQNGLLVEDQNIEKLIEALNLMVEDEALYQLCRSNTITSASAFSVANIEKKLFYKIP